MDPVLVRKQVDRLSASPRFYSADTLCRLLRYLVDHAIEHASAPVKEHQIATEVFGRPPDFDPRIDAIVRVQTGRLRARLAEYYGGPGSQDPIVIDIPKGSHDVVIHAREQAEAAPPKPVAIASTRERSPFPMRLIAALGATAAAVVIVVLLWNRSQARTAQATENAKPALAEFWKPFSRSDSAPLVVYSNAEFVGRPETGMRYYDVTRDNANQILDHYTGVGEVIAAAELTRTLSRLGRDVRLKRGRLLTLDDVKNSDVVFVGSPSENLALRDLETTRDFVFDRVSTGHGPPNVAIVNRRAGPTEIRQYLATPTPPIVEDYAWITFAPGLSRNRSILVLAGTTTLGTQAAAEFVCRASDAENLLARVDVKKRDRFEAVLRVRIAKGVPFQSDIIAVHPM